MTTAPAALNALTAASPIPPLDPVTRTTWSLRLIGFLHSGGGCIAVLLGSERMLLASCLVPSLCRSVGGRVVSRFWRCYGETTSPARDVAAARTASAISVA